MKARIGKTGASRTAHGRRGSALLMGLAILVVMGTLAIAYLTTAAESSRWTERQVTQRRLESAAESLIALSVDDIWGGFQREFGGNASHWDFRIHLDEIGIVDQSNAIAAQQVSPEEVAVGGAEQLQAHTMHRALNLATGHNSKRNSAAVAQFGGVDVERLDVVREDGPNSIRLTFEATVSLSARDGELGADRATVRDIYVIRPKRWEGLDYALLANNINCVMCHTDVDDAERFYNTDPGRYGTFGRVKLGAMESFQLRDDPHSSIAGTLYLAERGLTADGDRIRDWASLNFKSREFNDSGKLVEDDWGDLSSTNLSPASEIDPATFENLYVDYSGDRRVDGYMPDTFPSPFPDDGGYDPAIGGANYEAAGNRILDSSEFYAAASTANGTIGGGVISVVPPGETVGTNSDLETLLAGQGGALGAVTDGHVYLHGTEDNPIILNGDVAIDGDVIMHGVVKGAGALKVSGNVYMIGDVLYKDGQTADGDRTFGVAGDGTKNLLAVAAGGNIMIGNVFHPRWGSGETTGDTDGSFNFIMDELALFNRMEWMKTQPELPGKEQKVVVGEKVTLKKKWNYETYYVDKTVNVYETYYVDQEVPVYQWKDNGLEGQYFKRWKVQVGTKIKKVKKKRKTGTKVVKKKRRRKVGEPYFEEVVSEVTEMQAATHPNPHFQGDNYIPRYYGFTDGSTIPVFNKDGYFDPDADLWVSEEVAGSWDEHKLTYANPNDTSDPLLYDADGNPKAVVSVLTGRNGWISDGLLESLMAETLAERDENVPLEVNSTLYSNNSIFGIIPSRNAAGLSGEMILNGGIVSSDMGLLSPRGLKLNYDSRGKEILDITSDSELGIVRLLSVPRERID